MTENFRVLLPLRSNEDVEGLLRLMRAILPPHRTTLRRLYVHRPLPAGADFPQTPEQERAVLEFEAGNATRFETEQEMSAFAAEGFEVDCEVLGGSPCDEIVRDVSAWSADLVAVRTHDDGRGDHRIGRVTSALLSRGTCGVVTYREIPDGYRIRRILLATDFSAASREGVEWGGAVAELTGAEPRLVHVLTPDAGAPLTGPDEAFRRATAQLEQWRMQVNLLLPHPVKHAAVVEAENPADGILAGAREEKCDLIVLASTGASLLRDLLVGSSARKVVRSSPCPVLVIPKGNRVSVKNFLQKAWRLETPEACGCTPAAVGKTRFLVTRPGQDSTARTA